MAAAQNRSAHTLRVGRNGVMPAFNDTLSEDKIHILTAYVYGLNTVRHSIHPSAVNDGVLARGPFFQPHHMCNRTMSETIRT